MQLGNTGYFYKKYFLRLDFFTCVCYNQVMKKIDNQTQKSIFPFKLSKVIFALCLLCMAICVAGIVITVIRIVNNGGIKGVLDVLKYPLLIVVEIFFIVFAISVIIRSRYIVTDTSLITQFGIVKSTYSLKDITTLTLDTKANKLFVYQGEVFFVLSVRKEWQTQLIQAILQSKPDLSVNFTLEDGEPPKQEEPDEKN